MICSKGNRSTFKEVFRKKAKFKVVRYLFHGIDVCDAAEIMLTISPAPFTL